MPTIDDADMSIWSWSAKEIAFWQDRSIDFQRAIERLTEYAAENHEVYLYHIRDGQVSIAPKPTAGTGDGRAHHYQKFIQSVVESVCPELDTTIAVAVGDSGLLTDEVPVFVFQKPRGTHGLLLPDIDFVQSGFYEGSFWLEDDVPYDSKSCSAIFVGSTTGGMTVTKQVVRDLTLPRLRAAVYFKGSPHVQFHLPRLVQCDSPETEDLLRAMGFGSNEAVNWRTQFGHRFIISMDGNGATCSRVFVILRSNSVLLKYASPHQLHYFSGLIPWTHYIPIEADEDVNQILHIERNRPGFFQHIARQGQAFANRYLTRAPAMKYTGWLLRMYASSFANSPAEPWTVATAVVDLRRNSLGTIRVLAHIANRGDVWFSHDAWVGEPDRLMNIEGFSIQPGLAFPRTDIWYQAVLGDGSLSDWRRGGEFCGTRSKNSPLRGLRIRLSDDAARSYQCSYSGRFLDGTEVSEVVGDELCQSHSRASLVGFQINWMLRQA